MTSEPLSHALLLADRFIKCTAHRRGKISQYYFVVYKNNNEKLKKRHARYRRKRDYVSITLRSWNAAMRHWAPFLFVLNASRANGDYMLVRHDIFSSVYLLPARASFQVPSAIFHRESG